MVETLQEGQRGLVYLKVLDSQSKGRGFDSFTGTFVCNPEQVALLLLLRPSNET